MALKQVLVRLTISRYGSSREERLAVMGREELKGHWGRSCDCSAACAHGLSQGLFALQGKDAVCCLARHLSVAKFKKACL